MNAAIVRHGAGESLSQAVVHDGVVYVAGQVVTDGSTTVAAQTRSALQGLDAQLETAGTSRSRLLQVTIWLADIGDFAEMDAVWRAWLDGAAPPARATTEAALAAPHWRIEILATAAV